MKLVALSCGALCVALPAFALTPTSTDLVTASVVDYQPVRQIVCAGGRGTGFLIEGGRFVSVAHVTDSLACVVNGTPIGAQQDGELDFSTTDYKMKGRGFPINCDGFKAGTWVWAVGHAGGTEWQTMTRHLVTWRDVEGLRVLLGYPTFIPGMSGGAVLNDRGEVVGVVNMYHKEKPFSYSLALRDTSLCRANRSSATASGAKLAEPSAPPANPA